MKRICAWIKNNKTATSLFALAFALVLALSVKASLAYFTTYVTARGGYTLSLGDSTRIKEEFSDWEKVIQIENTGEVACYVRARIFAGDAFTIETSGTGWSKGDDGYWYYSAEVAPGELTESLTAKITFPADQAQDFDVVVVQECTPVTYTADGEPVGYASADWSAAAQIGEEADR